MFGSEPGLGEPMSLLEPSVDPGEAAEAELCSEPSMGQMEDMDKTRVN